MQVIRSGDQARFLPTRAALDAAMADGVQRLVFGHIHRHATASVGGGLAHVLPAFDAGAIGFRVDGDGLAAVRFAEGCHQLVPDVPLELLADGRCQPTRIHGGP